MKKLLVLLICLAFLSPAYAKQKDKGNKHKSLPPGLEKKAQSGKKLPPGWEKKVAKGEVLTDDVYSHGVPLTEKERSKYPTLEVGVELLKIENKIVSVAIATKIIMDVFEVGK